MKKKVKLKLRKVYDSYLDTTYYDTPSIRISVYKDRSEPSIVFKVGEEIFGESSWHGVHTTRDDAALLLRKMRKSINH